MRADRIIGSVELGELESNWRLAGQLAKARAVLAQHPEAVVLKVEDEPTGCRFGDAPHRRGMAIKIGRTTYNSQTWVSWAPCDVARRHMADLDIFDLTTRPHDMVEAMASLGEISRNEIDAGIDEIIQQDEQREADGAVACWWQDGELHLRYRGKLRRYRGSSVEGCDSRDVFVRHLARELINS